MSILITHACFLWLLSIVHYALKKYFKLFYTYSWCMMVIKRWLVLNVNVKRCDWFWKFLNTVLECSDLLHVIWKNIIYKHLFYHLFLELHPFKLFIAYSIVFIKKIRQIFLALGELPKFHKHKTSTKRLQTNKNKKCV